MAVYYIFDDAFPPSEKTDRSGILCVGGNLLPKTLLKAYKQGIFPWFNEDEPITWWCPNPRMVLFPNEMHLSKSMKQWIRQQTFRVSVNEAFEEVIDACRQLRVDQEGTWISSVIIQAYTELHRRGWAKSVEVWDGSELIGGLYGIQIGELFFGESMFSRVSNTSKLALWNLCQGITGTHYRFIDCQVENPHLIRMGARRMPRAQFLELLREYLPPAD